MFDCKTAYVIISVLAFYWSFTLKSAETVWKEDPFFLALFLFPSATEAEEKESNDTIQQILTVTLTFSRSSIKTKLTVS